MSSQELGSKQVKYRRALFARTVANIGGRTVDVLTLLTYVFLFAPIVVLVVYSFNASRTTYYWSGFTLDWYKEMFGDRYLLAALKNSAIVAVSSSTISTAIGTITGLVLVRRKFPGKNLFSTLMLAPLILPEIVIAVSFLVLMVFLEVDLGFFTLITGHIVITLPYATLILRARASSLDVSLEEAAADLGANEWRVFRRITLPLLMPGVLAAMLLSLTISFDNFVMSLFAAGVGTTTLPLRIFGMLKLGVTPEINALGSMLILLNLFLILTVGGSQIKQIMGGGGMG